jgi:hypothetical protein
MTEQQVEGAPRDTLPHGTFPGVTHLTDNLGLAENRGVETCRHLEEMGHRSLVMLAVEVRGDVAGGETARLAEEITDVLVGAVEALGYRVHLGAVARGQHHDLTDVVSHDEAVQRLRHRTVGDGDPLEQLHRRRAVVHPDDDDGHGRTLGTHRGGVTA